MRSRANKFVTDCSLVLMLFVASHLSAATIRVTTWNLQPNPATLSKGGSQQDQQRLVLEAAQALKAINPDVVLLQNVPDWKTCDQIARAMAPANYKVALCSSFNNAPSESRGGQVAILSKNRAYLSWSEKWQTGEHTADVPGGFAFAAIHVGNRNVGFFSTKLGDDPSGTNGFTTEAIAARENAERQLFQQFAEVHHWNTNRLQALIVGGDFGVNMNAPDFAEGKTWARFQQARFMNALAELPPERRVTLPGNAARAGATVDFLFAQGPGTTLNPQVSPAISTEHFAVTCELDFDAPKPAPPQFARAVAPENTPTSASTRPAESTVLAATPPVANPNRNLIWWLVGFAGAFVAVVIIGRRLNRRPQLSSARAAPLLDNAPVVRIEVTGATASNLPVVSRGFDPRGGGPLPNDVREGVIANLTNWMKHRVLRRLVSDRAELLATQQAAAEKLSAVDERLTKIEYDIQSRNREYEQRIDALMDELATAQEENRELIRAKIAIVKAEMERERLRAETRLRENR